MKTKFRQSALTASQEKFLLERINKEEPSSYVLKRLKPPAAVERARAKVDEFVERADAHNKAQRAKLAAMRTEAQRSVIFADNKENAQKAVEDFLREAAKLVDPEDQE